MGNSIRTSKKQRQIKPRRLRGQKEIEMKFEDDKPVECYQCGEMIYAGDCALKWDGKNYCCEDCVKDAMYEKYGNEVELRRLFTAEDYEAEYGDMKYDEMRGE